MISIRKSDARGQADYGWLKTRYTFSFAQYMDPQHMGFRSLRVINEDTIAAGGGFPTHPHDNMEIITYIVKGALAHRDSTGESGQIRRGAIQFMSAGLGIQHSEFNPSDSEATHLLQIWILPDKRNVTPCYSQAEFTRDDLDNRLHLLASPDGRDKSVRMNQDAQVFASLLENKKRIDYALGRRRYGWLQLISGSVNVNGQELNAGDGARIEGEEQVEILANANSEFLFFDLA